jgi:hypothetical protein
LPKIIINAFEHPLQQGLLQPEKGCQRKVAGHAAQAWQSSRGRFLLSLAVTPLSKENWLAAANISGFSKKYRPHVAAASLTSFNDTAGTITVAIDDSSLLPAHWLSTVTDWRYCEWNVILDTSQNFWNVPLTVFEIPLNHGDLYGDPKKQRTVPLRTKFRLIMFRSTRVDCNSALDCLFSPVGALFVHCLLLIACHAARPGCEFKLRDLRW